MKGKNETQRQITTVEQFMKRIACVRDTPQAGDIGNIALAFIGQPRRFVVRIEINQGRAEGQGTSLLDALEALIESVKRQ
jgi:hypothetical protein